MSECDRAYLVNAVASLGDRTAMNNRLQEIERALKFDPDPEYRRAVKRELFELTDKKDVAA